MGLRRTVARRERRKRLAQQRAAGGAWTCHCGSPGDARYGGECWAHFSAASRRLLGRKYAVQEVQGGKGNAGAA
jgi:hypothetical protein